MSEKEIKKIEEELEKIDRDKKSLEMQYKQIIYQQKNKDKQEERRQRTRRLIQKGALLEKYFEMEKYSIEDTEKFLEQISELVKSKKTNYFKERYHNDNSSSKQKEKKTNN